MCFICFVLQTAIISLHRAKQMSLKIHSVVYEAHIGFLNVIQLHFTIHADNMKNLTTSISRMLTLRFKIVYTLLTSIMISIEHHLNCGININR